MMELADRIATAGNALNASIGRCTRAFQSLGVAMRRHETEYHARPGQSRKRKQKARRRE